MQIILASLLLCSVALGGVIPDKRQKSGSPAELAVYRGTTRLGSVLAASDGSAARVTTGDGDLFYIEGSTLKGPVDDKGAGASRAFITFPDLGFAGCGYSSGSLTFTASSTDKCASSWPFVVTYGVVRYSPPFSVLLSSFQVCGSDQHIVWDAVGNPYSGCVDVTLVFEAPSAKPTPEPTSSESIAPSSSVSDAGSAPTPTSTDVSTSEPMAPSSAPVAAPTDASSTESVAASTIPIPAPTSSDLAPTSSEAPPTASESAAL